VPDNEEAIRRSLSLEVEMKHRKLLNLRRLVSGKETGASCQGEPRRVHQGQKRFRKRKWKILTEFK